jgi:hypothetical protein
MTVPRRRLAATGTKFDPFAPSPGGYRANGSWNENGRPGTALYNLVKELRHIRRTTMETPAQLVRRIPAPLLGAFPNAEWWATLTRVHQYMPAGEWCSARASTSAEASVVYAFMRSDGYPMDAPSGSEELVDGPVEAVVQSLTDAW